jgi:serine/threonine-protein phosphatase 5
MPKGSAPLPPSREGDLENRNPLWLKDRADGFMRMKNYSAALDAYNEAMKIDPSQRKILMNRSLAHMKLLNFDSALTDC